MPVIAGDPTARTSRLQAYMPMWAELKLARMSGEDGVMAQQQPAGDGEERFNDSASADFNQIGIPLPPIRQMLGGA